MYNMRIISKRYIIDFLIYTEHLYHSFFELISDPNNILLQL